MNNTFELISDLKIGHIVEVSGTTIRVELSGDVTELTRTHEGRVYPIGQIGSIVKVHFGRRVRLCDTSADAIRGDGRAGEANCTGCRPAIDGSRVICGGNLELD